MLDDEMLTIEELAAYLKLKPQTIYKWAQTGKIPGAKFGKEWRFRRSTIERWIDSHIPAFDDPGPKEAGGGGSGKGTGGSSTRDREADKPEASKPGKAGALPEKGPDDGDGPLEAQEPVEWPPVSSKATPSRFSGVPGGNVRDGLRAETPERVGARRTDSPPSEKVAGSRKGSKSVRKGKGPESN